MGKKKKINKKNDKIVKSINNGVRSSVRKLNPILKSIVGKKVDVAIRDLQFSEKRITRDIRKTISSAVANAENNFQYDIDKLIVKEAFCGKKVVMKRFRPRAKGRAAPILKPYSSVTIILSESKKIIMKRFRPRAKGRAAPILKPYSSVTIILSEIKKMESHGTKS